MKVLFMVNIPAPYRVDFFNELGKTCDLTVTFEGHTATDRNEKWKNETMDHFTPVFLKGTRTTSESFFCPGIIKILRQKWDIIVLGGYSSPTAMLAIQYLRLKKIPFYIEADGGFVQNDSGWKYKIKKHFLSGAAGWFSTGKATTEYLTHYGAREKDCFVYPLSSIKKEDIISETELRRKEEYKEKIGVKDKPVALFVGQFIPRKGVDVLLQAVEKLSSRAEIFIIGGGEKAEEYKQMAAQKHLNGVHFVDFLTKPELAVYYKAADIFVFPTREDIWGLVINEAMAYGLPVITTDRCVAGLELIENGVNGYLIPSEDSATLAAKMDLLLSDTEKCVEITKNNLKKISFYTIENMAKIHERFFADISEKENSK